MIQEIKVQREQGVCIARLHNANVYNKTQKLDVSEIVLLINFFA